jgi:hypothetical protein
MHAHWKTNSRILTSSAKLLAKYILFMQSMTWDGSQATTSL